MTRPAPSRKGSTNRALALVLPFLQVLLFASACSSPSPQNETLDTSEEAETNEEEASTTFETELETEDTDWEHCEPSPDDPIYAAGGVGHLGKPRWKMDPPPAVERGICSNLEIVEAKSSEQTFIGILGSCTDELGVIHNGMTFLSGLDHQLRMHFQALIAFPELHIEFQNPLIIEPAIHQTIRIFDPQGHLLLLGHSYGGGNQDEMPLGIPLGWEEPATWLAPFEGFAFRSHLCPKTISYEGTGWPGSIIRRAAIDVHTDEGTTRIFDRSFASVRAGGIDFDIFVGPTYQIIESSCGGCLPAYARFLAIRSTPLP